MYGTKDLQQPVVQMQSWNFPPPSLNLIQHNGIRIQLFDIGF